MATLSEAFFTAVAHQEAGRLELAAEIYRRILAADPNYTDALLNLGNLLQEFSRPAEAAECYRRAIHVRPDFVEAHNNLGCCLRAQWKIDEAIACFHQALALRPDFPDSWNSLGNALRDQGKVAEAMACYERAVLVKPDYAFAHNNLADCYREQRRYDEAVASYRRALQFSPTTASIWNNCGVTLRAQGKAAEAIAYFRRALEFAPTYSSAFNNLGNCAKDQGDLDTAIACFRRAVELNPQSAVAHSNLLYTLHYWPDCDPQMLAAEHQRWQRQHAEPLRNSFPPPANDRSPERRLRVGYVSADFYGHAVAMFLLPILEAHDRSAFEVFCYNSARTADNITVQCRCHADTWRDVWHLPDDRLAALVRQDQVDILVDLSLHTEGNRLLVFARKPAPVQVSYLGYCGTTGLKAIDYRLTDQYIDPPGSDESRYAEQSVRLPETYWCYRPAFQTPEISALPAAGAGHVTFGCLNNACKTNASTLAAWGRLLSAVPGSQLVLHCRGADQRDRVHKALAAQGVGPERIRVVDMQPTPEYFKTYQQIDIALDPFPYGGGTTTCDALWMGVPVVSLAGRTPVGRSGRSILSNAGLADLVAADVDQYVAIAAGLAADVPRLADLRATLRQRMQRSPLMDGPRLTRHIEAAYRQMWHRWCGSRVS